MGRQFVDQACSYLESKKVDAYEVFYVEKKCLLADARGGEIEAISQAVENGMAIRVINEGRLGFNYTTPTETNRTSISECANGALMAAREMAPDDDLSFAHSCEVEGFAWPYKDEGLDKTPLSEKLGRALSLEAAALSKDPRVKRVRKAVYEEGSTEFSLANSNGVDLFFEKTLLSAEVVAVAEADGSSQWSWSEGFSHTYDGLDITSVGEEASRRTLALLGARPIATMKVDCVLHPFVAARFVKALSRAFFGDNICKRKSPLAGRLSDHIYSDVLCVIDDGRRKGGYGSCPFDAEGSPTGITYLVRNGRVDSYLTDIYWGRRLKRTSTGSSVRSSAKEMPQIGVGNTYVVPGDRKLGQLLSDIGRGFYITDLIGAHTINPITGEFSVGAEGEWIEGGRSSHPVNGVLVAGNIHEMFKNVVAVADDLRFVGQIGSPSLLVLSMQVSGK